MHAFGLNRSSRVSVWAASGTVRTMISADFIVSDETRGSFQAQSELLLSASRRGTSIIWAVLRFILRDKARQTRGWLITAVLRDVPLENTINMVIANDMFLPVGTLLHSFRVSA